MTLAAYMILGTVAVFASGTVVALVWSLAAGQWRDLESGSRVVLDEE